MILLAVFTICESYVVGYVSTYYDPLDVFAAAFMTMGVTAALTAYACTTKADLTRNYGGQICWVLIGACFGFMILTLFGAYPMVRGFGMIFVMCLYGFYLIYDT